MGDWEVSGPHNPSEGAMADLREYADEYSSTGHLTVGTTGTWTSPEGYGTGGTGIAYILSPDGFAMTAHTRLISTPQVTSPYDSINPDLGGWTGKDPDGDPETTDLVSMRQHEFRGESMAGADRPAPEGVRSGEYEKAAKFDVQPAEIAIETSTMGLGYLELSTTSEAGYEVAKLFFNYSKISSEPSYALTKDMMDLREYEHNFYVENPFYYSEDESAGLQFKFGWDPQYSDEAGLGSALQNIFHTTLMEVVKMLNATYPINYATFPRTPSFKIFPEIISAIPGIEIETGPPAGTVISDAAQWSTDPLPPTPGPLSAYEQYHGSMEEYAYGTEVEESGDGMTEMGPPPSDYE